MKFDTTFLNKDLHDNDWIGVIINNIDSTFSGRAQVRVFGAMDNIIDEHIPWATPVNNSIYGSSGSGNLSVPKIGQFVRIEFNNGDISSPEINALQNIDNDLVNEIKEDYEGTHVLLWDPDYNIKIMHQSQSGLLFFYKESYMQITPDSMITLSTEDGDSIIQMESDVTRIVTKNEVNVAAASKVEVTADEVIIAGSNTTKIGPGPYRQALLAEPVFALLNTMATAMDNAKIPITGGAMVGQVQAAKIAMASTNVKISI